MALHLKLSSLATQPIASRQRTLDALVESARAQRNGQAALLSQRIREFELRYEMSSAELQEGLRSGRVAETAEIATWLFLLSARENRTPVAV